MRSRGTSISKRVGVRSLGLSRTEVRGVLNQVIGVPATSMIRRIPTEIDLDESHGMPRSCVLAVDDITAIRRGLCSKLITTLDDTLMDSVCSALGHAINCG